MEEKYKYPDTVNIFASGRNADEFIEHLYAVIKGISMEKNPVNIVITAKHLDALAEQVKELAQRKKEIENDLGE